MMKLKMAVLGLVGFSALAAEPRFDFKVREDFFAGFTGNGPALERAMKTCEEVLSKNPTNAEALVWHGGGLFFMSGRSFQKGEVAQGMELYNRGLKEMDEAVALAPDNVGVLIPRGATLLTGTRAMPPGGPARKLLAQGLADYEKVYELQKPYFDTLSGHAQGELLFGLAEGYVRAANETKAREYFEKLVAVGPSSGHDAEAKAWLETGKLDPKRVACSGCHAKA
jgi:tetratricopeptide (TPR) repeat protein